MRKRNYTVTIRMNKAEYDLLQNKVKESGQTQQAFEFGKEFAEKWFQGFQTLVAVHKDKDHIHCHLVTNSVSYEDGNMVRQMSADEATGNMPQF